MNIDKKPVIVLVFCESTNSHPYNIWWKKIGLFDFDAQS